MNIDRNGHKKRFKTTKITEQNKHVFYTSLYLGNESHRPM